MDCVTVGMANAQKIGPVARLVLQQCLSARLQVQPASETQPAQFVEVFHLRAGITYIYNIYIYIFMV